MRWLAGIAAGTLVVFCGMLGYTGYRVTRLEQTIERIFGDETMTLTTTWKSGNMTHTVTTPREGDETAAAHSARHKEAVEALKALYPPEA